MVYVVTQKILSKYAGDTSKEAINSAMTDFMKNHQNTDIRGQLEEVKHKIALALFSTDRVLDDGSFHVLLENEVSKRIEMI